MIVGKIQFDLSQGYLFAINFELTQAFALTVRINLELTQASVICFRFIVNSFLSCQ